MKDILNQVPASEAEIKTYLENLKVLEIKGEWFLLLLFNKNYYKLRNQNVCTGYKPCDILAIIRVAKSWGTVNRLSLHALTEGKILKHEEPNSGYACTLVGCVVSKGYVGSCVFVL